MEKLDSTTSTHPGEKVIGKITSQHRESKIAEPILLKNVYVCYANTSKSRPYGGLLKGSTRKMGTDFIAGPVVI